MSSSNFWLLFGTVGLGIVFIELIVMAVVVELYRKHKNENDEHGKQM